jgi:hypothetical protein
MRNLQALNSGVLNNFNPPILPTPSYYIDTAMTKSTFSCWGGNPLVRTGGGSDLYNEQCNGGGIYYCTPNQPCSPPAVMTTNPFGLSDPICSTANADKIFI